MQIRRWFLFLVVLFLSASVPAQNPDDAAKEKQRRQGVLIEQILVDLPNLKLGENRAIVYAKAGNLIWNNDQKRARVMFQHAVGELISAQTLAETARKNPHQQNELLTGQSTRPQILNIIAARDAEFALELLPKTRPAALLKALSAPSGKSQKISNSSASFTYLAQGEFNLEQTFVRMAADQSPERAAKLLRASLTKGLSNETLGLLKKLHEKDPAAAAEMATEIAGKLLQSKLTLNDGQPNHTNIQIAVNFLNDFIRDRNPADRDLKLDGPQMRALTGKLVSYFLDQSGQNGYYLHHSMIPIAEKLAPSSVEQLKKVGGNYSRHGFSPGYEPEIQKLLSGAATADELLAEAKKYPVNSRRQIYHTAANKLIQEGDINRAAGILNDNFSDEALEDAMRNLNWQHANNLINAGKFAEAERLIDEFPEDTRLNSLINLANTVYQRDQVENKTYATAILNKARSLTSEKPENYTEMSHLMQVIGAFANIDPSESFRLFEQLTPQLNELSDAGAVLNGFQGGSNVREGEFLITQGQGFVNGADFYAFRTFAVNDFDRTTSLIDAFSRREIRISVRLQLAENLN